MSMYNNLKPYSSSVSKNGVAFCMAVESPSCTQANGDAKLLFYVYIP